MSPLGKAQLHGAAGLTTHTAVSVTLPLSPPRTFFIHKMELTLLQDVVVVYSPPISLCAFVHICVVSWFACVHVDTRVSFGDLVILQVLPALDLGFVFLF